jgi:hypothetical protein
MATLTDAELYITIEIDDMRLDAQLHRFHSRLLIVPRDISIHKLEVKAAASYGVGQWSYKLTATQSAVHYGFGRVVDGGYVNIPHGYPPHLGTQLGFLRWERHLTAALHPYDRNLQNHTFIKTLTGVTISIVWGAHDTCDDLKGKIQDREGIPANEQRLIYQGRQLSDSMMFLPQPSLYRMLIS